MDRVTSKDGTSIAYTREGRGPAVVLVGGALDDGSENAPLAPAMAEHFTVYNYARRGRGESGDTQPYAVERELEDIAALIAGAGGSACVFGASSGGALALEAAAAGLAIDRLAVYEVPYFVEDGMLQRWQEYVSQLGNVVAGGRPGDALALFHRLTGFSDEHIAAARSSPAWSAAEALEHTLAYDAAVLGDGRPLTTRLAQISQPTLVATGRATPDSPDAEMQSGFLNQGADAIAASIPQAERQVIAGVGHMVDATQVAPVLTRFFTA